MWPSLSILVPPLSFSASHTYPLTFHCFHCSDSTCQLHPSPHLHSNMSSVLILISPWLYQQHPSVLHSLIFQSLVPLTPPPSALPSHWWMVRCFIGGLNQRNGALVLRAISKPIPLIVIKGCSNMTLQLSPMEWESCGVALTAGQKGISLLFSIRDLN